MRTWALCARAAGCRRRAMAFSASANPRRVGSHQTQTKIEGAAYSQPPRNRNRNDARPPTYHPIFVPLRTAPIPPPTRMTIPFTIPTSSSSTPPSHSPNSRIRNHEHHPPTTTINPRTPSTRVAAPPPPDALPGRAHTRVRPARRPTVNADVPLSSTPTSHCQRRRSARRRRRWLRP